MVPSDGWSPRAPPTPHSGRSHHRQFLSCWSPCCGSCRTNWSGARHPTPREPAMGWSWGHRRPARRPGPGLCPAGLGARNAPSVSSQGVSRAAAQRRLPSAEATEHETPRASRRDPTRKHVRWRREERARVAATGAATGAAAGKRTRKDNADTMPHPRRGPDCGAEWRPPQPCWAAPASVLQAAPEAAECLVLAPKAPNTRTKLPGAGWGLGSCWAKDAASPRPWR